MVQRHVGAKHARRVAELVGEVSGVPFPDDKSPSLRAARGDARLMGEQVLGAVRELLAAIPEHARTEALAEEWKI